MNKLLITTNNKGKMEELQDLLKDIDLQLITPADIHLDLDVIEDGLTYAANATKKAIAFANASGLISLADDSGLEVDTLDGAPGLYSARYGSPDGKKLTDGERRKLLIENLHPLPRPWTARFKATIAIASPDSQVQITEGMCEGEIIPEERGTDGFGYDPVFLFPELGKTMAELAMNEKNRLSHRAKAVVKAKGILVNLFEFG